MRSLLPVHVDDLPSVTPVGILEAVTASNQNELMHGHIIAGALIS